MFRPGIVRGLPNRVWDIFPGVDGTLAHDGGHAQPPRSAQRPGWLAARGAEEAEMSRNILFGGKAADVSQAQGPRGRRPRVGAVAAIVGGSLMVVHELWDARKPGIQADVVSSALHTTWIVSLFVAYAGLGMMQRSSFGRLGRVATVLALIGTGGIAVLAVFETVSRAISPQSSGGDDPFVVFLVLILASMGFYIVGGLLFAWATMRARVLPWSVGVLLIVTMLLKMFASGLIPGTLALMGAAFIWMGISALAVLRSQPARVSLGSVDA